MKTAIFSTQDYDRRFFDEALAADADPGRFTFVYHEAALTLQSAALAQDCDAVCVFVNDIVDAAVLAALKERGVRAILLRCAGFNNVDLKAAAALGFFVARVPAYSPEAVAEHAIAMIMTLNRNTHRAYNRVREGNFMLDGLLGMTISGKTAGIVGTGRIGRATARILTGFGCTVLGADPEPSPKFVGTMVELEALLTRSDIVSLHCPLVPATRHMINSETLALMKPGAMLINTSRGGLIDTAAVITALKTHHLGHLAIDVYEQESALFFQDHSSDIINDDVFQRLMTFPNVLVTGHQGFFTVEALREISAVTLANLACFADDKPCANTLT